MKSSVDRTATLKVAVLFAATWVLAFHSVALAEERIALVVGNGEYESVARLQNPVADGQLMAKSLESVGFKVTLLLDSNQDSMKRAIADFGRELRSAGPDTTGLFYYAGHGVQSRGVNFLLPVDTVIHDEADLDLAGVEADWVLRQLFSARNRTNIIILDACRDNPFKSFGEQGLAEMSAPTGTFIAYASAPGSVALDGTGSNSPFTEALSEGILVKGQPIEQVFKQVRISVLKATEGRQTPWDSSSLTGEFFFEPAEPVDPRELAAQQLWNSVKEAADPVQIIYFLRTYPDSSVSDEARKLLQDSLAGELGPDAALLATPSSDASQVAPEPPSRESDLIERAQASGELSDYETYLAEFPAGVFADLAAAEILNLRERAALPKPIHATEAATPEFTPAIDLETAAVEPATKEEPAADGQVITFLTPLTRAAQPISGRSISQIIEGSPQYPPVEGLPESYWKDQKCSNCHHWTKEALCTQGGTYLTDTGRSALDKQHPLDGFKQVLRNWASAGCG